MADAFFQLGLSFRKFHILRDQLVKQLPRLGNPFLLGMILGQCCTRFLRQTLQTLRIIHDPLQKGSLALLVRPIDRSLPFEARAKVILKGIRCHPVLQFLLLGLS